MKKNTILEVLKFIANTAAFTTVLTLTHMALHCSFNIFVNIGIAIAYEALYSVIRYLVIEKHTTAIK